MKSLYSSLLENSISILKQGQLGYLIKRNNSAIDISYFFGLSMRSDTYNFDVIDCDTKLTNPLLTASLTNEKKVKKDVIDIIVNNKFPTRDIISIKLFDSSSVATIIETEILSRGDIIKLWNILFKDIIDEYKEDIYYD